MSYSSILEAIKSASEVTPDKICLGDKKNKVTYKQFWKMINKGASFLEENGVKKGDVVGHVKYEVEGITYEADLLANSDVKPSRVFIKILIFVIILVFAFLYLKAKQNQKKKRKVKYYKGR